MPEGPEVETVRRYLSPLVCGRKIRDIKAFWQRTLEPSCDAFAPIFGQSIQAIEREGKYLLFRLDNTCFWVHLRMSGKLFFSSNHEEAHDPHLRAVIIFDDYSLLQLIDPRKFARIRLMMPKENLPIGPDWLNGAVSEVEFIQATRSTSKSIKAMLLCQNPFAGIGNIYADEALWLSQIHPSTPCRLLSQFQLSLLYTSILEVLNIGLRNLGTSLGYTKINFYSSVKRPGQGQHVLKAYRREGLPCFRCKTSMERIKVAGRSSFICPDCQKIPSIS